MQKIVILSIVCVLFTISYAKHHNKGPKNEPAFLKNVSSSARKEFYEISKNPGISIQQKEEKLEAWAENNNIEDVYNEFAANNTARKQELSKNVTAVISRLAEAKEAVDKVMENKSLTKIQQQEEIKELSKKYPQEVPTLFYIGKQFGGHDHKDHHDKNGKDSSEEQKGKKDRGHRRRD